MSNLWAMRGIKKMLMDKRLNKPRLKHRSYQLKSRSWMRQLTAKGNRIERLETERQELLAALGWIYHELREIKNRGPKTLNIDLDVIDIYRDFSMEIPDKESSAQAMNDFRIKHLGEGGK